MAIYLNQQDDDEQGAQGSPLAAPLGGQAAQPAQSAAPKPFMALRERIAANQGTLDRQNQGALGRIAQAGTQAAGAVAGVNPRETKPPPVVTWGDVNGMNEGFQYIDGVRQDAPVNDGRPVKPTAETNRVRGRDENSSYANAVANIQAWQGTNDASDAKLTGTTGDVFNQALLGIDKATSRGQSNFQAAKAPFQALRSRLAIAGNDIDKAKQDEQARVNAANEAASTNYQSELDAWQREQDRKNAPTPAGPALASSEFGGYDKFMALTPAEAMQRTAVASDPVNWIVEALGGPSTTEAATKAAENMFGAKGASDMGGVKRAFTDAERLTGRPDMVRAAYESFSAEEIRSLMAMNHKARVEFIGKRAKQLGGY